MKVKVRMIAFGNGEIREVEIPENTPLADGALNVIFHYGQNGFQPKPFPSVSVGDVIEYNGLFMVTRFGFKEITEEKYQELLALPRRERSLQIELLCEQ